MENLHRSEESELPAACRSCAIREIGALALRAGAACYVMTSAKDILLDLFVLCRYSLRPFAVGLLAGGVRGWMFPFEKGDCRDYRTWLQADRGIKEERTEIKPANRGAIRDLLRAAAHAPPFAPGFEKRGNILHPLGATGKT